MIEPAPRTPRVGIIGFGTIGVAIATDLTVSRAADIAFVATRRAPVSDRRLGLAEETFVGLEEPLPLDGVDLVIEAATPEAVAQWAPQVLVITDFCAFSCTAMAEEATERAVMQATRGSGRRFYVPHGAVLALDGIADGRSLIDDILLTTTKSGKSLGLDPDASGVVFDGNAREACRRFPRNVNVHAAVALAGVGFDRTRSRIVAVPGQLDNVHRLEVTGQGFDWDLKVASRSLGGVTGAYTPLSAAGSVRRILGGGGVVVV